MGTSTGRLRDSVPGCPRDQISGLPRDVCWTSSKQVLQIQLLNTYKLLYQLDQNFIINNLLRKSYFNNQMQTFISHSSCFSNECEKQSLLHNTFREPCSQWFWNCIWYTLGWDFLIQDLKGRVCFGSFIKFFCARSLKYFALSVHLFHS